MLWWGAEAQGSAECQGPAAVLAINSDSFQMCSELGCSSSAPSSHQDCSQATDRQGTVIFSEVQTTAPPAGKPSPAQRRLQPQLRPFSPVLYLPL